MKAADGFDVLLAGIQANDLEKSRMNPISNQEAFDRQDWISDGMELEICPVAYEFYVALNMVYTHLTDIGPGQFYEDFVSPAEFQPLRRKIDGMK